MRFTDLLASSTTAMIAAISTTQPESIVSEKTLIPASVFLAAMLWAIKLTRDWTKSEDERDHRIKRLESELAELKATLPCTEDHHVKKCAVCGECIDRCTCGD